MKKTAPLLLTALTFLLLSCDSSSGDGPVDVGAGGADVEQGADGATIDWDAFFAHPDWEDDGKVRVTILHTNDLHSHLDGTGPLADYSPTSLGDDGTLGGIARLASLVERERRDARPGEAVIALDAGDFTMGAAHTSLAPTLGVELRAFDEMGYIATTLGNHEFDWTPARLVDFLEAGARGATNVHVLASNLVFDEESTDDDALAALQGDLLPSWWVHETDNGLRIGLFGLLGEGARKLAPNAGVVTVRSPAEAAQEMVDLLREEQGVDLVVALSHSGVTEGSIAGEDEAIAQTVDGIDVIVSGHTHTLVEEPIVVGDTIIVQAGCYGLYLGRLTLVQEGDDFAVESFDALPVDDDTPGDPAILALLPGAEEAMDEELFADVEAGYRDAVALTDFDLLPIALSESNLGNLVSDGVRWTTSQYSPEDPVVVAFEANGVIRDGLPEGETGRIAMGDVLRVLPLGYGPDGEMGYPILVVHLTAAEIKVALEITAGLAAAVADSFYLQVSGLRFTHNTRGGFLDLVEDIYLGDEVAGFASEPLDTSAANTTLYKVAVNLYIAQMLDVVRDTTAGMVDITPKFSDGSPVEDLYDAMLDTDPDTDGVQELKLWRTLYDYLQSFPVDEATGLPRIPSRYSVSQERAQALQ